jgi:hypothetical protein
MKSVPQKRRLVYHHTASCFVSSVPSDTCLKIYANDSFQTVRKANMTFDLFSSWNVAQLMVRSVQGAKRFRKLEFCGASTMEFHPTGADYKVFAPSGMLGSKV